MTTPTQNPLPIDERALEVAQAASRCHCPDDVPRIILAYLAAVKPPVEVSPITEREYINPELVRALAANDALLRDIRHRDARWHDDEAVKQVLDANKTLFTRIETPPAQGVNIHVVGE